ncbi:MAG: phenylalanine--tRNA ligase subunit alpha, partial [Clostridia bacterium]|nr:phenylalanine--tRNA ligase subunit alpha [Clostridia bacterium]
NEFKKEFEEKIAAAKKRLSELKKNEAVVDLTVPSPEFIRGKIHPLIRVGRMFEEVYKEMGFSKAYGPEI